MIELLAYNFNLLQTNPPPLESVAAVLQWIIGVLIAFIVALILYFKDEIKTLKKELTTERDYIKDENSKNIVLLSDVNNIMGSVVKQGDKTLGQIETLKDLTTSGNSVLVDNSDKLKTIELKIITNGQ